MAIKTNVVSVGVAPTRLDTQADKDYMGGETCIVQPAGDMYVGGSDVTTASGTLVASGNTLSIDLREGDQLYGIVASGNVSCRVLQSGV